MPVLWLRSVVILLLALVVKKKWLNTVDFVKCGTPLEATYFFVEKDETSMVEM